MNETRLDQAVWYIRNRLFVKEAELRYYLSLVPVESNEHQITLRRESLASEVEHLSNVLAMLGRPQKENKGRGQRLAEMVFDDHEVLATIQGVKTQHRFPMLPQPSSSMSEMPPPLAPGDIIRVLESTVLVEGAPEWKDGSKVYEPDIVIFRADKRSRQIDSSGKATKVSREPWPDPDDLEVLLDSFGGWEPPAKMNRNATRILLVVKRVFAQSLNDITNEQALAEGVERHGDCPEIVTYKDYGDHSERSDDWYGWVSPSNSYRTLWDRRYPCMPSLEPPRPYAWVVEWDRFCDSIEETW